MKKITFRDPNHMLFESGHKTFDKQADLIDTGNVWGGVQFSGLIRAKSDTECNGFTRPPGHLRDFDLSSFGRTLPPHVKKFVLESTESCPVWLYRFFHKKSPGKYTTHGYIVTAYNHTLLRTFTTGPTWKSDLVIREAAKYVSDCKHPPERLYSWTAGDSTLCVGCCVCGEVLTGGV